MAEKEGLVSCARKLATSNPGGSHPSSGEGIKKPYRRQTGFFGFFEMAEKEGFEPPVPFPAHLISSQAHSATLSLLQMMKRKHYVAAGRDQDLIFVNRGGLKGSQGGRSRVPGNGLNFNRALWFSSCRA